jgi:hypothetical protein
MDHLNDQAPSAPLESEPNNDWQHYPLYSAVKNAIFSLPSRFESSLRVSGVLATDLFAFNSALSATIEEQVVLSLNKLRSVWDPTGQYALYDFERRPQTFPDVVLKASSTAIEPQILLGIELKGWYVLAKEKEPSFRYKVTPAVCTDADLLVVVPWALSEVVSGTPKVFSPFVVGAKYAAEYKNWHWQYQRSGTSDKSIVLSQATQNYPIKSDMISDSPSSDSGGNFGRLARTGLLDAYMTDLSTERLAGIPISAWQRFFSIFTEGSTTDAIKSELDRLEDSISDKDGIKEAVSAKFKEIFKILES